MASPPRLGWRLAFAAVVVAGAALPAGPAAAQYTPRDSAEESCRRVQEVKTPTSEPIEVVAPYQHSFSGGLLQSGESVDLHVDWGDGSPTGHYAADGPTEPGDPGAGLAYTYTTPGTYTWHSSGSRIMLIAISPSEGNLPCAVPIDATGTIIVKARAGGVAPAPATTAPTTGNTAARSVSPLPPPAPEVAAGRIEPASSGNSSPAWIIVMGVLALGAGAVFLGRRSGLFGGAAALPVPTATHEQLRAVDALPDAVEYVQNVHQEVSGTKQAHDAEMAKRREELVQHYLPSVGYDRGAAEVLADNDLSQYGTNAPMVTDVAKDVLWDAPTKGARDTWNNLTRWWSDTFGPKPKR